MPRIRKQASVQNLNLYDVLIEDTATTSNYFRISQMPEVFSAGKNSFLIGASPHLVPRSAILIEIIDSNKNVVYTTPIGATSEADARIISIEVYENTVPGPYKIIILGQANSQQSGDPIPPEWSNKYNVRWMKDIIVDPHRQNTSPLRFVIPPTIALVEEQRLFVPRVSYTPVTQSIDARLYPRLESGITKGYTVVPLDATEFNRKHIGGIITGSFSYINNTTLQTSQSSVYLPLQTIINSTTAISDGYRISLDNVIVESLDLYNSTSYDSNIYTITSSSFELRYAVIDTEAVL